MPSMSTRTVFTHGSLTFTTVDRQPFNETIEVGCELCGVLERENVQRGDLWDWRQKIMDAHESHAELTA